jgi:adenylyltransferase/sulfurtransferase
VGDNADKISRDKPVVIHCRSGARSGQAVRLLEQQHGFQKPAQPEGWHSRVVSRD